MSFVWTPKDIKYNVVNEKGN